MSKENYGGCSSGLPCQATPTAVTKNFRSSAGKPPTPHPVDHPELTAKCQETWPGSPEHERGLEAFTVKPFIESRLAAPAPAWEQINNGIPNTGKKGNWKHSLCLAGPLKYCTMLLTSINEKQGCAERLRFGNALTHVKHVGTGTRL